jgi:hypothetical protein
MLGAIVIDGMERYFPEIEKMKEKILILRDAELEPGSSSSRILKRAVQLAPYNAARQRVSRLGCLRSMALCGQGLPSLPGRNSFGAL